MSMTIDAYIPMVLSSEDDSGRAYRSDLYAANGRLLFSFTAGNGIGDAAILHIQHSYSAITGGSISYTYENNGQAVTFDTDYRWSADGITWSAWDDSINFAGASLGLARAPFFLQVRFTLTSQPAANVDFKDITYTVLHSNRRRLDDIICFDSSSVAFRLSQVLQGIANQLTIFKPSKSLQYDPSLQQAGPGNNYLTKDTPGFGFFFGHPNHCQPNQTRPTIYLWDVKTGTEVMRNSSTCQRDIAFEMGIRYTCGDREINDRFLHGREQLLRVFGVHSRHFILNDVTIGGTGVLDPERFLLPVVTLEMLGAREMKVFSEAEFEHGKCGCTWWRSRVGFSLFYEYFAQNLI